MISKKSLTNISSRETVVAQILLLIVLGCLMFVISWTSKEANIGASSDVTYLEIQIDGQRRAFQGKVDESTTLLDTIYLALNTANLEFQYDPQPQVNANISQISSIDKRNYEVYLNSVRVPLDQLGTQKVSVNDSVLVKVVETNN